MGRCLRLLLALMCAFAGVAAACQEVVIFADYRSLVVQSHRVDGSWTYLKVGSGEMAVPSASVLRVTQERTTGAPPISSVATQPSVPPPASPAVSVPPPWRSESPGLVRPPIPMPEQEVDQDEEEDSEAEMDEEEKEPEPPPSLPGQPGKMPPPPNASGPFQKPQEPDESKG